MPYTRYWHCMMSYSRPVGSSRRVERPSVVMSEGAQRPSVSREARKKFATYFYGCKEATLAASRYIEGRALTSRKKTPYRPRSSIQPAHSVAAPPHAHDAREWGVAPWHAKVETPMKKKLA